MGLYSIDASSRAISILINCIAQGVDACILIQANLYAGNMEVKNKYSIPFVILFVMLAINIGCSWHWRALALSANLVETVVARVLIFGNQEVFHFTTK